MNYVTILNEAKSAAERAATAKFAEVGDVGACGFAWVEVPEPKHAVHLIAAGMTKGCGEAFHSGAVAYSPSNLGMQSLTVLECGADAFAEVLKSHGIKARSWSRMD